MLSHPKAGSDFAAGPPVQFQARHKVPVVIKAVESLASIAS